MKRRLPAAVLTLALVFGAISLPAAEPAYSHVELKWSEPLRLDRFGCANVAVAVLSREMSFVVVEITDYAKMVPVAKTRISGVTVDSFNGTAAVYGSTDASMVPTRTQVRVKRSGGVPAPGTRSVMYLLHSDAASGVKVYFVDAIAPLNHDVLAVEMPPKRSGPQGVNRLAPDEQRELDRLQRKAKAE